MNHSERLRLAEIVKEVSLARGHFVLASGRTSDYYLDCRKTTLHPEGGRLVGRLFFEAIRSRGFEARAIGGLTLGADPIATAVAIASFEAGDALSAFIVRKKAKEHGTAQRIENCPAEGTPVVVVEDVVTSGGSALEAVAACRAAGLAVSGVVALVDREEGGREAIEEAGLPLETLYTARGLLG